MSPMPPSSQTPSLLDDDDGGEWMDMPVLKEDNDAQNRGLDEEDRKRFHYVAPTAPNHATEHQGNATGNLIDFDVEGVEWREKGDETNESEYTRLRLTEEEESDEVHLRTKYLFNEDKAMTPLSQMQTTKNLLTEAQRIGYVGLCALVLKEMYLPPSMKDAAESLKLWALKILGRIYYHMELETSEQKMIESLAEHGVQALDLVPSLMATRSVPNPEVAEDPSNPTLTVDIRWTLLCDLFLLSIADSVYDSRSRALLERIAGKLSITPVEVCKFEQRVTEALEIQESVESLKQTGIIENRAKASRNRRLAMMGLATLGGGLVIGLSAGLLAPVIGAGLGAAFATIGVSGTTGFLAGAGGAAVITTAGTLTGSGIAAKGMARRTRNIRTFEILPLHNNKRVNCILTVSGFMTSVRDDVRLPFSVLDPVVGDVFSVLWEPDMLGEAGSALKLLTGEVLSQVSTTVLQATVMTALMSALQWPILLTKLGYLIDNPWSNALTRAVAAGQVLADTLVSRHLGVRPVTLIGFSLGARVIFHALLNLASRAAYGIVQDVYIYGGTFNATQKEWLAARGVVAGRFVNGYARNDWVLNYLFRATVGGVGTIAGLRPMEGIPGIENIDVTDKVAGHTSYRAFMPLIMDLSGLPVTSDFFDEPKEPDMDVDRMVVREEDEAQSKKRGWFSRKSSNTVSKKTLSSGVVSRPPTGRQSTSDVKSPKGQEKSRTSESQDDDDLPERMERVDLKSPPPDSTSSQYSTPMSSRPQSPTHGQIEAPVPKGAGFDLRAIEDVIRSNKTDEGPSQRNLEDSVTISKAIAERLGDGDDGERRTGSAPPLSAEDTDGFRYGKSISAFERVGGMSGPSTPSLQYHSFAGRKVSAPPMTLPSISFDRMEGGIWAGGDAETTPTSTMPPSLGHMSSRIPQFSSTLPANDISDPFTFSARESLPSFTSTTLPPPQSPPGSAGFEEFGDFEGSLWSISAEDIPPAAPKITTGNGKEKQASVGGISNPWMQ